MLRNRLRKMAELLGVTSRDLGVDGLFVFVGGVIRLVRRVERTGWVYGRHGGVRGMVVQRCGWQNTG